MPRVYERTFRVRQYECDAYGHVNNTHYVRYMQEAAIEASADAGYDTARYAALGHHWLVRETHIDYLNPLRYGDQVTVKTWVEDVRRVRSRRAYDLRHAVTGEPVARAYTDWVYVETATGQPARVPPEMVLAFCPEGAPPDAPPRPPFPAAPPPPPGVFAMRRKVRWQDIDAAGHVNNAQYLAYASDCGFEVAEAHGWPASRMQEAGFGIIVRRMHVEYRQPAVLGDELDVATWAFNVRPASATRVYHIRRARDGALLARLQGHYVWAQLATGRPMRVPDSFMQDFAPNIAAG